MNERKKSHEVYGERLTPKLETLFPAERRDVTCRWDDGLHFDVTWREGESWREVQLWITGNTLDDYLLQKHIADDAEAKLLAFVKRKVAEL
ncbi:MAG TPA: hypothetical protein VGJ82_18700, partial [Thermoanaerobaculia bacterium]